MSSAKEFNALRSVPGFDGTKGERIVKALQRLRAKVENLEHVRILEKQSQAHFNTAAKDVTITDIQHKLLILQLRYARSIIAEKEKRDGAVGEKATTSQKSHEIDANSETNNRNQDSEHYTETACQETQTGNSLIENSTHTQERKGILKRRNDTDQSTLHSRRPLVASSKPHYHVRLNDVPFILGASSTASHSVVANVQNMIAMMKNHNKALCGQREKPTQQHSALRSYSSIAERGDTSKMLKELSQDLQDLSKKQETLVKILDCAQGTSQQTDHSVNKSKPTTEETKSGHRKTEATRLIAQVQNGSSRRERVNRQIVMNLRNQNANHPRNQNANNDRRLFLRSLQNFQSRLSEGDILRE